LPYFIYQDNQQLNKCFEEQERRKQEEWEWIINKL